MAADVWHDSSNGADGKDGAGLYNTFQMQEGNSQLFMVDINSAPLEKVRKDIHPFSQTQYSLDKRKQTERQTFCLSYVNCSILTEEGATYLLYTGISQTS